MKHALLAVIAGFGIIYSTLLIAAHDHPPRDHMVSLINAQRSRMGLPALYEDWRLDKSARAKACDMVEKNYWAHDRKDKNWSSFLTDAGYSYTAAAENLAKDYDTDDEAMLSLMKSASHSANILSDKYKEVGIGRCGNIIVQHFASNRYLFFFLR